MKLRRLIILASAALISSSFAVVGNASLAHADEFPYYTHLCIDDTTNYADPSHCILANGSGNELQVVRLQTSYTTNWFSPGTVGFFKQANTDLCMQVDHNAGNVVIETKCLTTESYQLWTTVTSTDSNGYFIYRYETNWDKALCLSYDSDGQTFTVTSCGNHWYQWFILN